MLPTPIQPVPSPEPDLESMSRLKTLDVITSAMGFGILQIPSIPLAAKALSWLATGEARQGGLASSRSSRIPSGHRPKQAPSCCICRRPAVYERGTPSFLPRPWGSRPAAPAADASRSRGGVMIRYLLAVAVGVGVAISIGAAQGDRRRAAAAPGHRPGRRRERRAGRRRPALDACFLYTRRRLHRDDRGQDRRGPSTKCWSRPIHSPPPRS